MAFPPVFQFLCKTVNLVKFIFFAASVFYKSSFNLFLLSPVGDPQWTPLLPFCVQLFLVLPTVYLRLFSFPLFFFFPLPLFPSPCGSECFNNDALGNLDGRTAFFSCTEGVQCSPSTPSFFFLSRALIPPSFNMSGKLQGMYGRMLKQTDTGL